MVWGKRTYRGGLDDDQLTFIKNDLELVPKEKLIMLMMHIPLNNVGNRQKLYRLMRKDPTRCLYQDILIGMLTK